MNKPWMLSDAQKAEMVELYIGGVRVADISRMFGVSDAAANRLILKRVPRREHRPYTTPVRAA